jgi:hypothetical protein
MKRHVTGLVGFCGRLIIWMLWVVSLLFLSGCHVIVFDEQRPLVRHEPIRGELELEAEKRIDEQGNGSTKRRNETTEFQEKLSLKTEGDIYHPDLLTYAAALGLGLRQSRFDFDHDVDKGSGTLDEYGLSGQLLRKQWYPMGFHFDKSEQFVPRLFTSTLRSQRESAGGTLALRLEDWPMHFQYGQDRIIQEGVSARDSDLFIREGESFRYSLEHDFSEFSNLRFEYGSEDIQQERFGTLFGRKEQRYNLRHDLLFGEEHQHHFDSFFSFLDQSGDQDLEQLQWQERLRLEHSDTFETHYSIAFDESERPTLQNDKTRAGAGFIHRLFQSLVTRGDMYSSRAHLGEGVNISEEEGRLGFDYQKKNPWGTFFGNYTAGVLDLEQTGGRTTVNRIDERHPFEVTGSLRIQLERTNIDASSIVVMDSSRSKFYSDYTVSQSSGITEIIIIPGGDITTDGDQTLSIDYDFFTDPQRNEKATTQSLTARERFSNGLSLYYQHRTRDERLSSADTDIVPDEFEINTFGTDYINKGLRLAAEYTREKSTRIPSRSKQLEASYQLPWGRDTKINLYVTNSWIDYFGAVPYDITLLTLGASASTRLTDNYSLFSSLDYRDEDDSRQGATEGFQWDIGLRYALRQLSISTGVEFNSLDRLSHETDNIFLYLRMKRVF